jgi:hypothetical protein
MIERVSECELRSAADLNPHLNAHSTVHFIAMRNKNTKASQQHSRETSAINNSLEDVGWCDYCKVFTEA